MKPGVEVSSQVCGKEGENKVSFSHRVQCSAYMEDSQVGFDVGGESR